MRWNRVLILIALIPLTAQAAEPSPEGLWATIDDRSDASRALVRVVARQGRLSGVVERVYPRPGETADPVCTQCCGERRGRPVVGMEIVWGHHREGSRWVAGRILDPENGKEYSSSLWLEGPDILRVRGRWGPFHRTQTWRRVADKDSNPGGGK